MAFSKSSIIKCSGFMIVIAITAFVVFMLTFEDAADTVKGFLGATAVSGLAGGLALIPVFYAVFYKPSLTQILSLAAGTVRLLLTIAGSVTICLLVNINFLWFFGWTVVFYLVILVIEIHIVLAAMNVARPSWPCRHGLEARATTKINGAAQA